MIIRIIAWIVVIWWIGYNFYLWAYSKGYEDCYYEDGEKMKLRSEDDSSRSDMDSDPA